MALPGPLQQSFSLEELEFVAELDEVEIVPLFKMPPMRTIAGMVGPFEPPRKVSVPIWMACALKKRRKCRIVAPAWMAVDHLEGLLKDEVTQPGFSSLPFKYMETSRLLLESASEDIPSPERVEGLLKDLREARQAKTRQGLEALNSVHIEMTNISSVELNEVRPFFSLAMKRLIALDPEEQGREEAGYLQDDEADAAADQTDADFLY